MLFVLEYFL